MKRPTLSFLGGYLNGYKKGIIFWALIPLRDQGLGLSSPNDAHNPWGTRPFGFLGVLSPDGHLKLLGGGQIKTALWTWKVVFPPKKEHSKKYPHQRKKL
jgi:hypothetical protein